MWKVKTDKSRQMLPQRPTLCSQEKKCPHRTLVCVDWLLPAPMHRLLTLSTALELLSTFLVCLALRFGYWAAVNNTYR